jgi:chemotaxis protein CheX
MISHAVSCDVLIKACEEVFGTMVFMSVASADELHKQSDSDSLMGSITFDGTLAGCLGFHCDLTCATAVAKNMLCMEPEDEITQSEINDALGEIANMLLGSIKANEEAFGKIHVSIPTVVRGREIEHNLGENANEAVSPVALDGQYGAELSLWWREDDTAQ